MKFKLDENVPLQLKKVIKKANYSVSDVYEENLSGKNDKLVIETCKKEKYVLITNDSDFTNIHAYPTNKHKGIIVFRLKKQGVLAVTNALTTFLEEADLNKIEGGITIIGSDFVRVRRS